MTRAVTLLLSIALPFAAPLAGTDAAERDRGPGLAGQRQGAGFVYPGARGFDGVSLGGAARVEVRHGPAWSVLVEGPAAALANFRVAVEGHTLQLGRRYDGRDDGALQKQIVVRVTLPRLSSAAVGGSGQMRLDRAEGDSVSLSVGGSGGLRVDRLEARNADLNVGGSGSIATAGQVGALTANVGGSGGVDAPGLRAARASVSVGGSGNVHVTVVGSADVSLAGSGSVDLGSQARCSISKVGSGTVRCGR
ncbi:MULTISPECIES: head GIN domain-containing protein [Sphingomonas]|jgi:hypothetical protein|uniref:head GIN domain-containing protein n=1 Tax=Sphingomonas TaxID=13687 RepID=UPI001AEF2FB7|nr:MULTISPECIES: head GIN domain-containing protein [Sphingomonas]